MQTQKELGFSILAPPVGRVAVVGMDLFGLEVLSILLGRMYIHRKFTVHPRYTQLPLATFVWVEADQQAFRSVKYDHSNEEQAFNNFGPIYRKILHNRNQDLQGELRKSLHPFPDDGSSCQQASQSVAYNEQDLSRWAYNLLFPIACDTPQQPLSSIHIDVYFASSVTQNAVDCILQMARALTGLHQPVSLHLILNTHNDNPFPVIPAKLVEQKDNLALFQTRYVLSPKKHNYSAVASVGEIAIAAANYLDAAIFSLMPNAETEHQGIDDIRHFTSAAPWSTFGAVRMHIPIAEAHSFAIEKQVQLTIQNYLDEHQVEVSLPKHIQQSFTAITVCKDAMEDLPIQVLPRRKRLRHWLDTILPHGLQRRIAQLTSEELAIYHTFPRLMLDRRHWRIRLQQKLGSAYTTYGRVPCVHDWWKAVCELEKEIEERDIADWMAQAKERIGVESITPHPSPSHLDADARANDHAVASITPHHPSPSQTTDEIQDILKKLPPDSLLARQHSVLENTLASYIATPTAGIKSALSFIKKMGDNYQTFVQAQQIWNKQQRYTNDKLSQLDDRLTIMKQDLVRVIRTRIFPVSLILRISFIWMFIAYLLSFFVLYLSSFDISQQIYSFATWLQENARTFVILWTVECIAIYILILNGYRFREKLLQKRMENVVLNKIDAIIEQQTFGQNLTPKGLYESYLLACERIFFNRVQSPDPQLSSLAATVDSAIRKLERRQVKEIPSILTSSLDQPIGYTTIQRIFAEKIHRKTVALESQWKIPLTALTDKLHDPQRLAETIHEEFYRHISQRAYETVQPFSDLSLATVFAHEGVGQREYQQLQDELRARAQSMFEYTHQAEDWYRMKHYLIAEQTLLAQNSGYACSHQDVQSVLSLDPFSISYISIQHGIQLTSK